LWVKLTLAIRIMFTVNIQKDGVIDVCSSNLKTLGS
jgi:hypothetical protein